MKMVSFIRLPFGGMDRHTHGGFKYLAYDEKEGIL
jgi:hypothetical protein